MLNILDVVQLQRVEKINTAVQTATADLSIEGANVSRYTAVQTATADLSIEGADVSRYTAVQLYS